MYKSTYLYTCINRQKGKLRIQHTCATAPNKGLENFLHFYVVKHLDVEQKVYSYSRKCYGSLKRKVWLINSYWQNREQNEWFKSRCRIKKKTAFKKSHFLPLSFRCWKITLLSLSLSLSGRRLQSSYHRIHCARTSGALVFRAYLPFSGLCQCDLCSYHKALLYVKLTKEIRPIRM